jgi:hypothetical protein
MGVFDILSSERTLARKALYKQLENIDLITTSVYQGGYNEQALNDVLAMPYKKDKIKNKAYNLGHRRVTLRAELLKEMANAAQALKQGNIEPAIQMAGQDFKAFQILTQNPKDIHALKAKSALYNLKKYNNPPGDHGDSSFSRTINFASAMSYEAIEGYNALGMVVECEDAMRRHITNNKFGERDNLENWLKDFHANNPETHTKNMAAYNIVKSQPNGGSFEDHIAAIKYHPDDKERQAAIKAIDGMLHPVQDNPDYRKYSQLERKHRDELFVTLANHVRTTDGSSVPSQFDAMRMIMKEEQHRLNQGGFSFLEAPMEQFLADMEDELRMGTAHVVEEGFIKGGMLAMIQANDHVRDVGEKRASTITNLLTSDLEGERVNQARNALAEHAMNTIVANIQYDHDIGHHARTAAMLMHDVLVTASPKSAEAEQAAITMRQLVILEDSKTKLDQVKLEKDPSLKSVPELGYGRAMVDALKYEGMEMTGKIIDRIGELPPAFVPAPKAVNIVPA